MLWYARRIKRNVDRKTKCGCVWKQANNTNVIYLIASVYNYLHVWYLWVLIISGDYTFDWLVCDVHLSTDSLLLPWIRSGIISTTDFLLLPWIRSGILSTRDFLFLPWIRRGILSTSDNEVGNCAGLCRRTNHISCIKAPAYFKLSKQLMTTIKIM